VAGGAAQPELSLPWPALRRFLLACAAWSFLLGAPVAYLAHLVSSRSAPVYLAEATLIAPLRAVAGVDDAPAVAPPLAPRAYQAALRTRELLAGAWSHLTGRPSEEADQRELSALADALALRWDSSRRSLTLVVAARGPDGETAAARANAVAEALVAWDDARARAEVEGFARSLESQLEALEAQAAALRASGSRADQAQLGPVTLLATEVRQSIALTRARAVAARGNLEFLVPATRASQVAPNPLVNAVTVFVLTAMAVLAAGLVRAGLDRRVHAASGLADVAGVPVLADLTRRPAFSTRGGYRELGFLKAQLDRAVADGGEVLVTGLAGGAVQLVASSLDRLYSESAEGPPVKVGAALLGSGEALERAARADAVVLVAEPRTADRVELRQVMAWLRRVRANVVGLVAAGPSGAAAPPAPGRLRVRRAP